MEGRAIRINPISANTVLLKKERKGIELVTKLDKEIEEASNIEGNVRDELSVLPICLHRYPDVHRVYDPSCPGHPSFTSFFLSFRDTRRDRAEEISIPFQVLKKANL